MSQATAFDPAHPEDAQFVENVIWEDAKVMFVTVNPPGGSNNDLSPWTAPFNTLADKAAQTTERTQRTAADIRWLTTAFDRARANNDKAVVVLLQADMWDPEALPSAGGAGLDQYTPFVQALADKTAQSGVQVLLVNGDTHLFKGPARESQSCQRHWDVKVLDAPCRWLPNRIRTRAGAGSVPTLGEPRVQRPTTSSLECNRCVRPARGLAVALAPGAPAPGSPDVLPADQQAGHQARRRPCRPQERCPRT